MRSPPARAVADYLLKDHQPALQPARAGNARRMPQPRRGFHTLSKGFSLHAQATHGACPSPAGAFTPSARASARTRRQRTAHAPAPQGLSRPQQGLQPARAGNARRMPQPRRGFHALSKGFSPHAQATHGACPSPTGAFTPSARASARTNSTFINPTVRTFGNRSTETLEAMSSGGK
jgi:hypothetical protein